MRTTIDYRFPVIAVVALFAIGCAHNGPDPFTLGPDELGSERATPPACFTAPLEDCVGDPTEREPAQRLASPWNEDFEPDLAHRICRGDPAARQRWIEGARHLGTEDPRERIYLELLGRCSTSDFCDWAIEMAGSEVESGSVRRLLLEGAWRWCGEVLDPNVLERVGLSLDSSLTDRAPWVTNSQQKRCSEIQRFDDPWQDMIGLQGGGCLDLGEWLRRHRGAAEASVAALERCVNGSEIRYQEANCLRELAGLDRKRAVSLVRADDRRGWGISSTITRYARILIRFPEEGGLETELARLDLLPTEPPLPVAARKAPVLPVEVLEHRGRSVSFNPGCSARYCEHARLMYRLMDLTSPALDDVVLVERWPALETVVFGSGPRKVSTTVGGISVTLHVTEGEDGGFDRDEHDRLRDSISSALNQSHVLTAYTEGRAYRLRLRNLGDWFDLETLMAGLNTMLADRGSELRYATLDHHCVPCAKVVAGPRDGLIEAAFDGLLEVTDPFKELWTQPGFEPSYR